MALLRRLIIGGMLWAAVGSLSAAACPPEHSPDPASHQGHREASVLLVFGGPARGGGMEGLPTPYHTFDVGFEAQADASVVQLCRYNRDGELTGEIQSAVLSADLPTLHQAGQLWQQSEQIVRHQGAIQVAEHYYVAAKALDPVAPYLGLVAVNMLFETYDYSGALEVADTLQARYSDFEYGRNLELLKAEIWLRQSKAYLAQQALQSILLQFHATGTDQSQLAVQLQSLILLSESQLKLGLTDEGESTLQRAVALVSRFGENWFSPGSLVTLYDNFGYLYIRKAQQSPARGEELLQQALDYEYRALEMAVEIADTKQQAIIHSNIGWIHSHRFAYDSAQRNYLIALALLQSMSDTDLETNIYKSLGLIYHQIGLHYKAIPYLQGAILRSWAQTPVLAARLTCYLTQSLIEDNQLTQAQAPLKQCLAYFSEPDAQQNAQPKAQQNAKQNAEGDDVVNAMLTAVQASRQGIATQSSQQDLLAIIRTHMNDLTSPDIKLRAYLAEATQALIQQDDSQAAFWFAAAEKDVGLSSPTQLIRWRKQAYEYYRIRWPFDRAQQFAETTHKLILRTLQTLEPDELGPAWLHQVQGFYEAWMAAMLKRPEPDFLERSMSLSLLLNELGVRSPIHSQQNLQDISAMQGTMIESGASNPEAHLALAILTDLGELVMPLPASERPSDTLTMASATGLSRGELALYADTEIPSHIPLTVSVAEVQSRLKANEQIVQYWLMDGQVVALVIRPRQIFSQPVTEVSTLDAYLLELSQIVEQNRPAAKWLDELAGILFPVGLQSPLINRSYLIANNKLVTLPLSALILEASNGTVEGARLYSTHPLLAPYEPTATSWTASVIASPSPGAAGKTSESDSFGWLPELRWSQQEAQAVEHFFRTMDSRILLGNRATRRALFDQHSRHADVLHIAAHHVYQPQFPDYIGLLLSPEANTASRYDFVGMAEISHNRFFNRLVFLNGCETGQGRLYSGVGVMSMARAFIRAGAQTVIYTLWPVSDKASSVFARQFYQYLQETQSPVSALRLAKLAMQQNPRFHKPFYWAGYELAQSGLITL